MDPAAQLQPYLRGGEQLLWSGRPDPQVRFTRIDLFLVPFRWSRDARHVNLVIDRAPMNRSRFGRMPNWFYGNTGLYVSPHYRDFAFYDVADPQAMLGALDQARGYFAA